MAVVIDTNVLVVASRLAPQADERCVNQCMNRLAITIQRGGLLVDAGGLVLLEYMQNLGYSGQPGAGHVFAKWAHDHQAIPVDVRQVAITPIANGDWRTFEEFPNHAALSRFDRSDQKFVAVAVASGQNPPILNDVDSDWWDCHTALSQAGVTVEFLCPQHAP